MMSWLVSFAATATYQFAANSPLQKGKWVRITVPKTGVYEISFSKLRELGFTDPKKVAVMGKGGPGLPLNFYTTDALTTRSFEDVPTNVAVAHLYNKLIFYAYGPEKITANQTGYKTNERMYHIRTDRNVYSDVSYYYLTDAQTPLMVSNKPTEDKSAAKLFDWGYTYDYREEDLMQGGIHTGQTFWGRKIEPDKYYTEERTYKYCVDTTSVYRMELALAKEEYGDFFIYFNNAIKEHSFSQSKAAVFSMMNDMSKTKLNVAEDGTGTLTLKYIMRGGYSPTKICNIDYEIISYPINLGLALNDESFTQQYMCFRNSNHNIVKHPAPAGCYVWDITNRATPQQLDVEDGYFYDDYYYHPEVVVFNPTRNLSQPTEYVEIENQNLHGLQAEGADMLIVTLPEWKEYADKIATLHREHDGMSVLVVTPQEIYNEFSYGMPDPMAVRCLTKMLYQSPNRPLKNVLFIGHITSDIRNINKIPGFKPGILAYTLKDAEVDQEQSCVMDFYGCMNDFYTYLRDQSTMLNAKISMGVGLLPITDKQEAENVVAKIEEYLNTEDFSNIANETMVISCLGDQNLHDTQAINFTQMMQDLEGAHFDSELDNTQLWMDGLGSEKVRDLITESIEHGKVFSVYIGHSGALGFGDFSNSDMLQLDNSELGFMFMAGCDLCAPDLSIKGIGDIGVLRSKRGLIGNVCATRPVISNHNEDLLRNFGNAMIVDGLGNPRTTNPTIGEVYSIAKTKSLNTSQSTYVLIGDPALRIPVATGRLSLTTDRAAYSSGEVVKVSGQVLNSEGEVDSEYNGYVTVKVAEPERKKSIASGVPDLMTREYPLTTVRGKVTAGVFEVSVPLTSVYDRYKSTADSTRTFTILAATHSAALRKSNSGRCSIAMAMEGSEPSADAIRDTEAPTLTLTHDPISGQLRVEAADDMALTPGIGAGRGVALTIDGKNYSLDGEVSKGVSTTYYEGYINTLRLSPETHQVTASAVDLAGNRSETTTLTIQNLAGMALKLTIDNEIAIETLGVDIKGTIRDGLVLIVTDREGNVMERQEISGAHADIDLTDLPIGSYRLAAREESIAGNKIFSNWVEFTVIK